MKFLPRTLDGQQLMMLRTYYNRGSDNYDTPDDVLDFVYKDISSGRIYIESIPNPKIEIYVVKPEFRNYDYYKNFIEKDKCDKYLVPYKNRYKEIGTILGVTPREAKYSFFVFQLDMDIEHFYIMQFYKEYGRFVDKKPLSLGFSDIESDIINCEGFAEPGQAPTNCISYFDENTKTMYTFVCIHDNIPHVKENHPKYNEYEKLRNDFQFQAKYFMDNLDKFKLECKEKFEESYGEIEYRILIFEDEISMHKAYWQILDQQQNDYLLFWNAPYDISNLIERVRALGYDPNEIISCPEFGHRIVYWHEDKNPTVHKRKHVFDTYTKCTIEDQMVNYSGKRSGRGKLPSHKLNSIAKNELKDEKIDYAEYGNIKVFCYENLWKFILYNIKDVLLQVGIERKTKDTDYVYLIMSSSALKTSEIFTSTTVVGNDLRLFADINKNMVMGSNKNKLFKVRKTDEEKKQEKKDKFAGAVVMNPTHCTSTGFMLLGALNKYIHDNVIDFDIGSEYPTGMLIMNCSNDTMVGKVYLKHPEDIDIELYKNMYIIDEDDKKIYNKTANTSNLMMEGLSENNPVTFGEVFFKLPSPSDILQHIEENIDDFI